MPNKIKDISYLSEVQTALKSAGNNLSTLKRQKNGRITNII